jgi:hypothetical protein
MKRSIYDWVLEGLSIFWLFSLLALFFYVGLSFLERFYHKFNYPVKVTENNATTLYKLALGALRFTSSR